MSGDEQLPRTWADAAEEATRIAPRASAPSAAEPADDDTVLSSRVDGEDDSTLLSSRADLDDDSTRLSSRADVDDDSTRLSSRAADPIAGVGDDDTRITSSRGEQGDSTRLTGPRSHQTGGTSQSTQASTAAWRGQRPARPDLPPGVLPAQTSAGAFGTAEEAYGPRHVPLARGGASLPPSTSSPTPAFAAGAVLSPAEVARRRAAQRRRRTTQLIIIASVAAALLTGAVLAAVALVGQGS